MSFLDFDYIAVFAVI